MHSKNMLVMRSCVNAKKQKHVDMIRIEWIAVCILLAPKDESFVSNVHDQSVDLIQQ